MRKKILYLIALLTAVITTSCNPDPIFNEDQILGKWKLTIENGKQVNDKAEFWKYFSDGKGYTWDESDDVTEEEAQWFEWTLTDNDLVQIHLIGDTPQLPKSYKVTTLNESTLSYTDNADESVTRTFKKQ